MGLFLNDVLLPDSPCLIQLFQNILESTELRFPKGALEELHPDSLNLCRSLLRQNPGICCCDAVCKCARVLDNYSEVADLCFSLRAFKHFGDFILVNTIINVYT